MFSFDMLIHTASRRRAAGRRTPWPRDVYRRWQPPGSRSILSEWRSGPKVRGMLNLRSGCRRTGDYSSLAATPRHKTRRQLWQGCSCAGVDLCEADPLRPGTGSCYDLPNPHPTSTSAPISKTSKPPTLNRDYTCHSRKTRSRFGIRAGSRAGFRVRFIPGVLLEETTGLTAWTERTQY